MDKFKQKIKILLHSLRLWIFLVVLVIGLVPCLVIRGVILHGYEEREIKVLISDIQNQGVLLADQVTSHNYLAYPSSETVDAQVNNIANTYSGRVLIINDALKVVKDSYRLDGGKTLVSTEAVKALKGEKTSNYNEEGRYIEIAIPISGDAEAEYTGAIIISVATDHIEDNAALQRTDSQHMVLGMFTILVIIGTGISSLLTYPVRRLGTAIENSVETYDMPVKDFFKYSETDGLVTSIDKTLARMRRLDESRQEFVSNVSHELKTPITSMKVLADSLVGMEDVPIEIYKEFMEDITVEIDRENNIIQELLSLVRLDKKAALNIQSTNISVLTENIMKRIMPIAQSRNIELIMESLRPVFAEIDEGKMGLAFSNLIENAVKYNVDGGWVKVTLEADHRFIYFIVEDSGRGIPEEEKDLIFERFYRGDKSHSSEINGSGLGLSITRNAVALHHGTIEVESELGKGSKFTIKIPPHYD